MTERNVRRGLVSASKTSKLPRSPLSIALHNPLALFQHLAARRVLNGTLGIPRDTLQSWSYALNARSRLPENLRLRWESIHTDGLSTYSGGATIGPQNEFLYYLVRFTRPQCVVETGVASGFSSAYILQALEDNGHGTLDSIDLPNTKAGGYLNDDGRQDLVHIRSVDSVGEVVPEHLRHRWRLHLADSKSALPGLLKEAGIVSMFFHDSDHSYGHVKWELETVWPHLESGGLLVSDDIGWTPAFRDFCRIHRCRPFVFYGRGGIRKP